MVNFTERYITIVSACARKISDNGLVKKLNAYYLEKSTREQKFLRMLAVFLIVVLGVYITYQSMQYSLSAQRNYRDGKDTFAWMQENQPNKELATRLQQAGPVSESILGVATQSAKVSGIEFSRYEPQGERRLSLWIEDATFNKLIIWLNKLRVKHGVVIEDISLDAKPTLGNVSARIVLQG